MGRRGDRGHSAGSLARFVLTRTATNCENTACARLLLDVAISPSTDAMGAPMRYMMYKLDQCEMTMANGVVVLASGQVELECETISGILEVYPVGDTVIAATDPDDREIRLVLGPNDPALLSAIDGCFDHICDEFFAPF